MFSLIYTSKEQQKFAPRDLKKLLVSARIRNSETGVTGMLVYQDGTFLQVLEGKEEAVEEIFSRIERDTRHGDIRVLSRNVSRPKRPMFGEWSMGFSDVKGTAQILRGFIDVNKGPRLSDLDEARTTDFLEAISKQSARHRA
jgi:Sensors of blue-light using FAD